MDDARKAGQWFFAAGLVGLGVLTFVYGDFTQVWQPVPAWVPGREYLAYASGAVMLASAVGTLSRRTAALSSRVLLAYLFLWLVLLKVPKIVAAPTVEVRWSGFGEIAVIAAGGLVLFATLHGQWDAATLGPVAGDRGLRIARYVFGFALLPLGLSHFVYFTESIGFVPAWLPYRAGWVSLTGAGHIAAGLGVLFGILPRLAATLEASMIGIFTLLVWGPGILATPTSRNQWTAFLISWTIGAAAWVVAGSLEGTDGTAPQRAEA